MLIRNIRQFVAALGSLVFITSFILILKFYDGGYGVLPNVVEKWSDNNPFGSRTATPDFVSSESSIQDVLPTNLHDDDEFDLNVYGKPVHEVFSISGKKGKYFEVDFGDYEAINPNLLAHPYLEDTWIMIAQKQRSDVPNTVWFAELVCDAKFKKGKLSCIKSPTILPIAATTGERGMCTGDLSFLNLNVGPHDARAFYGPSVPYVMYGSQSTYNCFGLWVNDLRFVYDWGVIPYSPKNTLEPFRKQTELQRPPPYGVMEKNWFLFWDTEGQMYTHYDISPKRVFSRQSIDGSAGPDLAPITAREDEKCMARYMPQLAPSLESIHQATNSLSVTLCKRSDPTCKPNPSNTFVMNIFQFKSYYNYHSVYEPYVMLFQQSAPFAVHGISQKPIWIHGRKQAKKPDGWTETWDQTEMFYITSISWKGNGMKYHGYIDDELFIAFGIEDQRAAAIDVLAGDILDHMGLCSDVQDVVNPVMPAPDINAVVPDVVPGMPDSSVADLTGAMPDTTVDGGNLFDLFAGSG